MDIERNEKVRRIFNERYPALEQVAKDAGLLYNDLSSFRTGAKNYGHGRLSTLEKFLGIF